MTAFGLIALILVLILLAQPLWVIIGGVTAYCNYFYGDQILQGIIEDAFFAANKELLLAIPLFVLAGNLMTSGGIARRLIRIAAAFTAPIPGGLAVAAVLSCAVFAAISGSSPVTLVAIGSMMYPALLKGGYSKNFSLGVLAAGGTLGIIIPPSIPMIIFAIMASVSVTDLFLAGVGPGLLLMGLLMIYSFAANRRQARGKWDPAEVLTSLKEGVFAMLMPIVILGGIYSGIFTATESAAVAVAYAVIVELFIHRELGVRKIPGTLADTAELVGTLFLILVLAMSLNKFMTFEQIPQSMVEVLSGVISTQLGFWIGVNILLLIVGCAMDIMSAILVLAPMLTPMAIHYGINPIHFGIVMIVNLEIGYLTPPVGVNLFVASGVFKTPLGEVIRAVAPALLVMVLGLLLVTFIPQISLFLLN